MTQQKTSPTKGRQADTEITDEMIAAAAKVLRESGVLSPGKQRASELASGPADDPITDIVKEIIQAAHSAQRNALSI